MVFNIMWSRQHIDTSFKTTHHQYIMFCIAVNDEIVATVHLFSPHLHFIDLFIYMRCKFSGNKKLSIMDRSFGKCCHEKKRKSQK